MTVAHDDDEFRGRLAAELDAWEREGLITPEQARAIRARVGVRAEAVRATRLGPVVTFVAVLGAVVLGVGVVLFFAANWEVLPAWFKVLLVFMGMLGAYAAGYWVQFRWGGLPRVGAGLILLGALLFQAGIFLLEQIFNMPVDRPIALLLGAAGILPLAYALRSPLILVLGLADGVVGGAWQAARWVPSNAEPLAVPLVIALLGIIVYAASAWHEWRADPYRFAPVYQVFGLLTLLLPIYLLTWGDFWDRDIRGADGEFAVPGWFAALVALGVGAAAALALPWRRVRPDNGHVAPAWLTGAEAGVLVVVALLLGLAGYLARGGGGWALLFNAVFFGLAICACVRGYLEGAARYVNVGIPLLALGLISRYFDVFWDLLPRSAFYIAGGVVLLAVAAALERLRQRLLAGIPTAPAG